MKLSSTFFSLFFCAALNAQVNFYALTLPSSCFQKQYVNKECSEKLKSMDYQIKYVSTWLNTIIIYSKTQNQKPTFGKLMYFIDSISDKNIPHVNNLDTTYTISLLSNDYLDYGNPYGYALENIQFLGLEPLHKLGYTGTGINAAVFDGGFTNIQRLKFFDSLRNTNRYLGNFDFSFNKKHLFKSSSHGTQVLGCMAANLPGVYIGTAPSAHYAIYATESTDIETPLEEWAYICALEHAYNNGIKLIQCSLGYSQFDNKTVNHTYSDLVQSALPIFKAIQIAISKGMVLVNSAGNEGNSDWKYVSIPSASPHVISVGAATNKGKIANFSSYAYSKKIPKPNTLGIGHKTHCINTNGYLVESSGTSYAAPCVAGAIACIMQLIPEKKSLFYKDLVQSISNNSMQPDSQSGYGKPNFALALHYKNNTDSFKLFPFFSTSLANDTWYCNTEIKSFAKAKKIKIAHSNNTIVYKSKLKKINSVAYGTRIGSFTSGNYTIQIKRGLKKWKKSVYFVQ